MCNYNGYNKLRRISSVIKSLNFFVLYVIVMVIIKIKGENKNENWCYWSNRKSRLINYGRSKIERIWSNSCCLKCF